MVKEDKKTEIEVKQEKVRRIIEENGVDGIVFSTNSNFKWLSCGGASDVIKNADTSLVYLFFTGSDRYLIASRSDVSRVMEEELKGLGFKDVIYDWYSQSFFDGLEKIGFKGKLGSDTYFPEAKDLSGDIAASRCLLTSPEIERYKIMCKQYSEMFTRYCRSLRPGLSEREIAAGLCYEGNKLGMRFPVLMVGSDERISAYRHPTATDKKVNDYVLFATVVEREGVCANVTRSIYFGSMDKQLAEKQEAVNTVEATYQHSSRPGITLGELFEIGKKAYKDTGYDGEWQNHLQGGISGYAPLEFLTVAGSDVKVKKDHIMGWNPTIKGAKSEDPIHITEDGPVQYTIDKNWPSKEYPVGGKDYIRPLIMEI